MNTEDHTYSKKTYERTGPSHLLDHNYAVPTDNYIYINQQYADDISYITNQDDISEKIKSTIPEKLARRNLKVNTSKTEEFTINRSNDSWKRCRYLGSLLDTSEDIKRRKSLAMTAFNSNRNVLTSKLDIKTNIRIFNAYVSSIFLFLDLNR